MKTGTLLLIITTIVVGFLVLESRKKEGLEALEKLRNSHPEWIAFAEDASNHIDSFLAPLPSYELRQRSAVFKDSSLVRITLTKANGRSVTAFTKEGFSSSLFFGIGGSRHGPQYMAGTATVAGQARDVHEVRYRSNSNPDCFVEIVWEAVKQ